MSEGSTNGANIPLKDEGSFSFIYLYIKVEALCLCISDNLSIQSLEVYDVRFQKYKGYKSGMVAETHFF